jgi:3-oxochol-4-en-24-oyl-CoA dehydrogenase
LSATITDEQFAARDLVRGWAVGSGAAAAVRAVEQGDPDAWRAPYDGLAQLGIFGVAVAEEHGGAGGTVGDLCAMVDEAAAALLPGPVATTALATLVVADPEVLEALASGRRTAGVAFSADLRFDGGRASGTAEYVLGAEPGGVLLLRTADEWLVVDGTAKGVTVEPLTATDFSRPLARVVLDSAPAEVLSFSRRRVEDLAATVLAAEAAGLARWMLDTATDYAKVREQFGKPIGSFQAVKHMCADMLLEAESAVSAARFVAGSFAGQAPARIADLALAQAYCSDAFVFVAATNIQVHGGIGFTWEHPAHLYLRRARSDAQLLGSASWHRERYLQQIGA